MGISIFVIPSSQTSLQALIYGALLGLITYGIYDLTNFSIIKEYSLKITIIDIIWGTFLLGIVSFLTKIISIII